MTMFQFDLQLFGGGGGGGTSTTIQKVEVAPQTEEERRLQAALKEYQDRGLAGAKDLQKRAMDYINSGGLVNPDWNELLAEWNSENDSITGKYKSAQDAATAELKDTLNNARADYKKIVEDAVNAQNANNQQALNEYQQRLLDAQNYSETESARNRDEFNAANEVNASDYTSLLDKLAKEYTDSLTNSGNLYDTTMAGLLDRYTADSQKYTEDYRSAAERYLSDYDREMAAAKKAYENSIDKANTNYDEVENPAYQKFSSGMDEIDAAYKDITNGKLLGEFSKNRVQALTDDMNQTMGSYISNMAKRGLINSTVSSSGIDSINQSISDTLAKNYSNDLTTQANLLNGRGTMLKTAYDTSHGKAVDERNASKNDALNTFRGQSDVYGSILNTKTNAAENLFKNSQAATQNFYDTSNKAEESRYANSVARFKSLYDTNSNAAKSVYDTKDALAKTRYATNLDNLNKMYEHASTNAENLYNTTFANNNNTAKSLLDVAGNIYNGTQADAQNIYNAANGMATNIFNADQHHLQNKLTGALQTQIGSYYAPNQMMDMADQLYLPSQNQYNVLYSGRHGASTTTTTTTSSGGNDNSGLFGAIGSVGSALIACFTAGTQITTPDGYKKIEDIRVGDEVISVNKKGEHVIVKVKQVNEPHKANTVVVQWDNSTRWRTTINQRFYDGTHFAYMSANRKAVVFNGLPAKIININEGPEAIVYDFTVDNDHNVFFANDVAAEGFGD